MLRQIVVNVILRFSHVHILYRKCQFNICNLFLLSQGSAHGEWHQAGVPGPYAKAKPSAQHLKSTKSVIRKPLVVFFFHLNNIIDHYSAKFDTTVCI